MLKPYNRQQIMTDKVLSSISNMQEKNILEQILTRKGTLYNIIHIPISIPKYNNIPQYNIPLKDVITKTDSVVIVVDKQYGSGRLLCMILDKHHGYLLNTLECMYVGTERFTILNSAEYIIETNYRSVQDVYTRFIKMYMEYILDLR